MMSFSSEGKYYWMFFWFSPLITTVFALKNHRYTFAKNILWAFIVFYGFTFAIGEESTGSDIVRYVEEYQLLYGETFTFEEIVKYYRNRGEIDVLRTFLAMTVSRFSNSQSVLTAVYGLIFGFFFSRNLFYLLSKLEGKSTRVTFLLLSCFFLAVPIWNINGFRMYTAMHIFFYGLMPYLLEGKKQGLLFCFGSVLIHFSFLFPILVLSIYLIVGSRVTVYFYFFLASHFISAINLGAFNAIFESYMPSTFVERTKRYRGKEVVEWHRNSSQRRSNYRWYALWYGKGIQWSLSLLLLIFFLRSRNFIRDQTGLMRLLAFTLLMYGFANIVNSLPSGGRFLSLAYLAALALLVIYVQNFDVAGRIRKWVIVVSPALLLFIVVSARIGFYSFSVSTLFGNPILALLTIDNFISLNDLIKW